MWVLILVCDQFTYVRREDLGSIKCRLSRIAASKGETKKEKEQNALD
jgi:hypothetical protein